MDEIKRPYIIFDRKNGFENISFQEVPSSRRIDPTLETNCRKRWESILEEARAKEMKIWESEVYRFEHADTHNGDLKLTLSTIPFSIRLAMNDFTNEIERLGTDYAPLGIFNACFVHTNDQKLLFIEKSKKYFTTKTISFIGGILSKSESIIKSKSDLFEEVRKEVMEEVHVEGRHIESIRLLTGYITGNFGFCLLFNVFLNLSHKEVELLFEQQETDEAEHVISASGEELSSLIASMQEKDAVKFRIAKEHLEPFSHFFE